MTKDFLYRRAEFASKPKASLQTMLKNALAKLPYASKREQHMGEDEDDRRLWNHHKPRGLLTCGTFVSWERGRNQPVIQGTANAVEYKMVLTEPPKTRETETSEFNEGLLFFGAYQNHVIVLQSASLRVSALEDYLNWLLQDATNEMSKSNRLELLDEIPRKYKSAHAPLKSITLTPSLSYHDLVPVKVGGEHKEAKVALPSASWGWLKDALGMMHADVPKDLLLFDEEFKASRLHIEIALKWTGRDKERGHTPLLDSVLRSFRDVDNPPIRAVLNTGEKIEGKMLRLVKPENFKTDGRIPVMGDVFEKMQKYMTELLERRDIIAD